MDCVLVLLQDRTDKRCAARSLANCCMFCCLLTAMCVYAGDPPGPVSISLKVVLNGDCDAGPVLNSYSNAQFDTNGWTVPTAFAAGTVALPAGDSRVTVCMGTVGWLNFMGLRFTAITAAPTRELCTVFECCTAANADHCSSE
jgi:hypothetical protein